MLKMSDSGEPGVNFARRDVAQVQQASGFPGDTCRHGLKT
jgi:hypothetical protein